MTSLLFVILSTLHLPLSGLCQIKPHLNHMYLMNDSVICSVE